MTKRSHRAGPPNDPAPQLPMAFTTRLVLDDRLRADVVALLSRFLLQAASLQSQGEVGDDRP